MYTKIAIKQQKNQTEQINLILKEYSRCDLRTKIVNFLLSKTRFFGSGRCFISYKHIAKVLGCNKDYVGEVIREALSIGVIERARRFNLSNVYRIPKFLCNETVIEKLASVLPALRGILCLSFLMPFSIILGGSSKGPLDKRLPEKPNLYYNKELFYCSLPLWTINVESKKEGQEGARDKNSNERGQEEEMARFAMQEKPRYKNGKAVEDYKDFMNNRLPCLVESLKGISTYSDLQRADVIERQVRVYKSALLFADIVLLREEGFDV